jgi:hypothetical protein
MRSGGRLTGRLGGRAIHVRLPGYAALAAASGPRGSADAALASVFGAPFVAKSSPSRLVPSRVR